jgi:hypothetical protein
MATFIPPQGWQRIDTLGTRAYFESKINDSEGGFCQIILYPSSSSANDPEFNFQSAWNYLVTEPTGSGLRPRMQTENTPYGWTIVTGGGIIPHPEGSYNTVLACITGYGKTLNIQVNLAGDRYAAVAENFFNTLVLEGNTSNIIHPTAQYSDTNNLSLMNAHITLEAYEFTAPDKWQLQRNSDHLLIQNMESGCLIRILEPQPSSGDLEKDALAVFDLMYSGWQPKPHVPYPYVRTKGNLPLGLEYSMIEAAMSMTGTDGRYTTEDGAAMVVKAGSQIVVISVRHSSLLAHVDCLLKYETLRRFFNSFTIKNAISAENTGGDDSSRIIGKWHLIESMAKGDYIFTANGHYFFSGSLPSVYTTTDSNYDYLHTKTYNTEGDGYYSLSDNKLTLHKNGSTSPEVVRYRFEKVNYGGTAWKERLYLLREGSTGQNETRYEKETVP